MMPSLTHAPRALLVLLLAGQLSACGEGATPVDPPSAAVTTGIATAEQPADIPILQAEALVGEFRVAAIDGEPVDENFGIALTIAPVPSIIILEIECGTFVWAADVDGGVLYTNRLPAEPRSCDTPVHPRLLQLAAAIDAARNAARTPANGIELSGGGHSVLLFSQ